MHRFHRLPLLALLGLLAWGPVAAAVEAADGPVYSLAECIGIALEGSPTLAISRENETIAAKNVTRAWGAFLPSASVSRTWNKSERTDFDVTQTAYDQVNLLVEGGGTIPYFIPVGSAGVMDQKTKSTYQDYGVNANLNLFDGFAKYGGLKSARRDREAAAADRAYTRQLVIQNVTVAYLRLIRDERLLEVAQESQALAERELEKSETYHRIGSAARSDVLQAKVRVEQTKLDVIRARNTVEQSFADLAHAMNRPLAQRFQVDRTLMEADLEVRPLDALFDEALANREDLRSRALQVEARAGDVTSAGGNLWPSIDVFARYTKYENESPFRFGAQKSDNLSYGYQVNWNVFDRLQTITGRSQAKARKRIAEHNLDQARLDVQLEVRQLYNAQVEARERVSLARETIVNAEEELRLAQERFRVGAGTMLDRITAQVNLATARGDEVSALADFVAASLQLDRAVGRSLDSLLER